jgi:hypothetical protein
MLGTAIFLLVVDVLARTERFAKSTKKGRISLLVFHMVLAALFGHLFRGRLGCIRVLPPALAA